MAGINVILKNVSVISGGYKKNAFTAAGSPSETFTLTNTPSDKSLFFMRNGLVMKEGDDYSLSGRIITTLRLLEAGDEMEAVYAKA